MAAAESRLLELLTEDGQPRVRRAAGRALRQRRFSEATIVGQRRAYFAESDPTVRMALLQNLAPLRRDDVRVEELLRQAAGKDASHNVRQAAADLLGR